MLENVVEVARSENLDARNDVFNVNVARIKEGAQKAWDKNMS
jgi:hypothetical protein